MKNLLDTIGQTPLVQLQKFLPSKNLTLFVKLEGQNPGGSIKDRTAKYMIREAEKRGDLKPGKVILEATSGNMGIALAMIGAHLNYEVQIIMSAGMSEERKTLIRALGAKLILTDPALGTAGAIKKARKLVRDLPERYWFADQFNNPDNSLAHYHSLAPEILAEFPSVDYLVAGLGTSGTIMGLARRFKEASPTTKIIGVLPPAGYQIQGIQHPKNDFHGEIYQSDLIDEYIAVSRESAFLAAQTVAQREGLFVGMSSGAALAAARQLSHTLGKPANLVVILPDRGEKYLSTELF